MQLHFSRPEFKSTRHLCELMWSGHFSFRGLREYGYDFSPFIVAFVASFNVVLSLSLSLPPVTHTCQGLKVRLSNADLSALLKPVYEGPENAVSICSTHCKACVQHRKAHLTLLLSRETTDFGVRIRIHSPRVRLELSYNWKSPLIAIPINLNRNTASLAD